MSERNELLRLLDDNITDDIAIRPLRCAIRAQVEQATDAILAAGYRKPRVITTAEELDALPLDSIIKNHDIIVKVEADEYHFMDGDGWGESRYVHLPVTVLWEPK